MSVSGGPRGHRASISRVLPVIPLALEVKSRRSLDQHKLSIRGRNDSHSEQPVEATHISGGGTVSDHVISGKRPELANASSPKEKDREHFTQSGSESSQQTDAAQSTQSNEISPADTTSEPQSSTATSFGISIPPKAPDFHQASHRPSANGDLVSPHRSLPPARDISSSAVPEQGSLAAAPHPSAAPFVPSRHAYHSFEPYLGSIFPPSLEQTTASHHPHPQHPLHTPSSSYAQPQHPYPLRVLQPMRSSSDYNLSTSHDTTWVAASSAPESDPSKAIHPTLLQSARGGGIQESNLPSTSISGPYSHPYDHRSMDSQSHLVDPAASLMAAAYLLDQFGDNEFADYILLISHSHSLFSPLRLPAHAVVLARSPKFRSLIKHSGALVNGNASAKEMTVIISDKFIGSEQALIKAIKRLYSGDLLNPLFVTTALGLESPHEYMRFALGYAAAGHYLEIDEIVSSGVELAHHFLDLNTVGLALAFATDGGFNPVWSSSNSLHNEPHHDMKAPEEAQPGQASSELSQSTYGVYSDVMLRSILALITRYMSPRFALDTKAPQLVTCPRLPQKHDDRHNRSNSRLTQIRFGEMITEADGPVDETSRLLSSILISLPYLLLKHFLEHDVLASKVGLTFVAELMRATVDEREARRKIAEQSKTLEAPSGADDTLLANLQWAEYVERSQQHACGFQLCRLRIEPERPKSSSTT